MLPLLLTDTAMPGAKKTPFAGETALPNGGEQFAQMFQTLAAPSPDVEEELGTVTLWPPAELEPDVTISVDAVEQAVLPDEPAEDADVIMLVAAELGAPQKPPVDTGKSEIQLPHSRTLSQAEMKTPASQVIDDESQPIPNSAAPAPKPQNSLVQTVIEGRLPKVQPAPQSPTPEAKTIDPATAMQPQAPKPGMADGLIRTPPLQSIAVPKPEARQTKLQLKHIEAPEKTRVRDPAQIDPRAPAASATSNVTASTQTPPPAVVLAQAMPPPQNMMDKSLSQAEVEITGGLAANERGATVTPQTATAAPPTAGAETARHVANQIAVAVSGQPGRPTEIALNPEELGRVRLSMTAMDASITLSITAERPETTDLLRRHIETLAQEFRALGYDNVSFSFGGDTSTQGKAADDAPRSTADTTTAEADPTDDAPASTQLATSGLDLRL